MRQKVALGILLAAFTFIMFGCGGGQNLLTAPQGSGDRVGEWYYASEAPAVWTLFAGKTIAVGTVTVHSDQDYLYVDYQITDTSWFIYFTAVAVGAKITDIPQAKGNPIPGQFPYKQYYSAGTQTSSFEIPRSAIPEGKTLYVATHANVGQGLDAEGKVINGNTGWAGFEKFPGKNWAMCILFGQACYAELPPLDLPGNGICATGTSPNGIDSYWLFNLTGVPSGFDVQDGNYDGWCLQQNVYWYPQQYCGMDLYDTSIPDSLPEGFGALPWNEINWLLNFHDDYPGTYLDVQKAIWVLSQGQYTYDSRYGYMTPEAEALVLEALEYPNFVPGPGQITSILLYKQGVQGVFIEVINGC